MFAPWQAVISGTPIPVIDTNTLGLIQRPNLTTAKWSTV